MTESTDKPDVIQLDYVRNGKAQILVHWNAEEIEKETDEGTETHWQYDECRMQWVIPKHYDTREEVSKYLAVNQDEILDWAKGSKVTV